MGSCDNQTHLSTSGIKCGLYTEHLKAKTNKLVILSPVPCGYHQSYDEIKSLVKALLADENKANAVDDISFDEKSICFNPYTPVMRYFDKSVYNGEVARNVVMLEYEFPQDFISNSRRLIDIKTGLPLYAQGGNVFEEYGLEAKKTYTKPSYNIADVQELRQVDREARLLPYKAGRGAEKLGKQSGRLLRYRLDHPVSEESYIRSLS